MLRWNKLINLFEGILPEPEAAQPTKQKSVHDEDIFASVDLPQRNSSPPSSKASGSDRKSLSQSQFYPVDLNSMSIFKCSLIIPFVAYN